MLWNTISGAVAIVELLATLVVLIWFSRSKMGKMTTYNLVQTVFNVFGLAWCILGTLWIYDPMFFNADGDLLILKSQKLCTRNLYLFTTWMLFTLWGCLAASVVLVMIFTSMAGMGQVDELVEDDGQA